MGLNRFNPAWVIAMIIGTCGCSGGPKIDASGLSMFWDVRDLLLRDQTPKDGQWNALFSAPGYAQLEREERQSTRMKPLLELAYMPSRAAEADAAIKRQDLIGMVILPHLRLIGENRAHIERFVERFSKPESITQAVRAVAAYLPKGAADRSAAPPLFLTLLNPDGKAFDESIVFDAFLLSICQEPAKWIGHELHHFYRRGIDRVRHESIAPEQADFIDVLTKLEQEGVADLVDKREIVHRPGGPLADDPSHPALIWMWTTYMEMYAAAPASIASLDDALKSVSHDPTCVADLGARLKKSLLKLTGRPIGMFMADTIDRQLGRDRLILTVGNPFAFARVYAEAAVRSGNRPALSDAALRVLADWEACLVD